MGILVVVIVWAILPSRVDAINVRCPVGTVQGPATTDECYLYKSVQITWPQAEAECVSYGGHLTSIENRTHNNFIFNLPNMKCASSYWTGGNLDRTVAGKWAWVDSTPWGYTNWATGM
ncbi:C-type lectin domain family 10 member A [Aphelenchoides avenae]|nr:C-type lectin domain family 10 member A [Aphelenchus avenae]